MATLEQKMQVIKLVILDVDGVMTDGTVIYSTDGSESKGFNTQDGFGINMAQKAGLHFGALTGRVSQAVERRISELKFDFYKSGHIYKIEHIKAMINESGLSAEQVLYMGDDIVDLACAPHVGIFVAPANAPLRVREKTEWITESRGGHGAVREMLNTLLAAQGRLDEIEASFLNQT
ncbi:MAG: HAD-IIIA family hydrolase [Gammaproteobacteria bacterium]|nr:HAD-IIIA family hydrolase [Gammaproteobacteria bacterium]